MNTPQNTESTPAVTPANSSPNSPDPTPPVPSPNIERDRNTAPPPDQPQPITALEAQRAAAPRSLSQPLAEPIVTTLAAAPEQEQEHDQEQETAPTPQLLTSPTLQLPNPPTPQLPTRRDPIIISSVLGKVEELPEADQMDYFACEEVIDGGWATYVQVGLAFATIRDRRLYRNEFTTFEEYCRNRWEYGRRYVDQLIAGAQVFTYLRASGSQMPEHERQVRPLIALAPEQARMAWNKAVERAGGKTVTARLIKNVVNGVRSTLNQNQEPRQKRPSGEAKHRLIDAAVGELLMLLSQKANHGVLTQKVEALHGQIRTLFPPPALKRKGIASNPAFGGCKKG